MNGAAHLIEAACHVGRHLVLRPDPPIDYGECVNVNWRCSWCGTLCYVSSWEPDAWKARTGKLIPPQHREPSRAFAALDKAGLVPFAAVGYPGREFHK